MLVMAQIVAGIGAGVVLPSIYALATTIAPKGSESAVLGRVLTGWSVSLVVGVPASALIADLAGWRASFLALAVLAAASLMGTVRLPAGRAGDRRPGARWPARTAGLPDRARAAAGLPRLHDRVLRRLRLRRRRRARGRRAAAPAWPG